MLIANNTAMLVDAHILNDDPEERKKLRRTQILMLQQKAKTGFPT